MRSYRILIVEDEILAAMSLQLEFERQGQEVMGIVKSEAAALALCEALNVDIVLLDVNLGPGISGAEIGKSIQRKFGIPLLFMTGYELENIEQELAVVESIGVVKKPVIRSGTASDDRSFFSANNKYLGWPDVCLPPFPWGMCWTRG